GHHADVYLALAVAGIVGAMIVPLPPWLLDALLALNLGLGFTLLVAALYARDALKVAAFPTLLLITTLFRLALNVSSTRLALIEAHAGEVIQAFGEFAIQGEYVVGGVIFAILTLVQFLVVAKGAERVAEVGARFILDAMPGKQMAIDADLRAGAIDMEQARFRRRSLERESQMYGAMDGAMKFVKGDAIAGLIIVLINAFGGLIIGVLFKGMDAGSAARTYALLAIGDGLVSQIPALCIAISAGLVVTRVAGEDERASLGADIARQFASQPKGLAIVAVLLASLGLMPMMPKIPFFLLAGAAGLGARALARRQKSAEAERRQAALESTTARPPASAPAPSASRPESSNCSTSGVTPICLDLDASLEALARAEDNRLITKDLPDLREALYLETGVRFPGVRTRAGAALGEGIFEILVDEIPCARSRIESACCYVACCAEDLALLGVEARPHEDPISNGAVCVIAADDAARVREAGFVVRTAAEQMLRTVALVLRRQASSFLGVQEVQSLLDALEKTHPALVREASGKVPVPVLAEVLRRLAEEGVSIRNLRAVLEAVSEPGAEGDALALAERCRRALRRHLSHRFAADGTLYAHLADPMVEEVLREAVRSSPEGCGIALDPSDAVCILDGVREALGGAQDGVVLAAPDIRRVLRKLLEGTFPQVAVLTYGELMPELQVRPVGKIAMLRAAA
ncbi:MAG: type III secretion system export apparatus subunit SctV, partial [Deltaproteobacteria bacterium]|nr:type III secretion system export apparatus subunit SctV [Deltaproteobacteria bacterium]